VGDARGKGGAAVAAGHAEPAAVDHHRLAPAAGAAAGAVGHRLADGCFVAAAPLQRISTPAPEHGFGFSGLAVRLGNQLGSRYTRPTGRAGRAAWPGTAHGTAPNKNVPCRPIGPEMKPGSARSLDKLLYIYFFINFVFLIKNLFNIIKCKLKIYDFTLNNIIKIVYIIFLPSRTISCRANRADHRV
jgi:hypothetical protein